jgi:eukaryotic-like serine/threonine-protein kinase
MITFLLTSQPTVASDPEWLARLEQEAQAASALNHPNIVSVYDVTQQDSKTWIVSELVEGQSLRQVLDKGPLPLRPAFDTWFRRD